MNGRAVRLGLKMSDGWTISLLLAVFAATGALGLATYFRSHRLGRWLPAWGLSHAVLGCSALAGLAWLAVSVGNNFLLNSALLFFILAVVGGGFAYLVRARGEAPILPIVLLHAATAVAGFLLLLAAL